VHSSRNPRGPAGGEAAWWGGRRWTWTRAWRRSRTQTPTRGVAAAAAGQGPGARPPRCPLRRPGRPRPLPRQLHRGRWRGPGRRRGTRWWTRQWTRRRTGRGAGAGTRSRWCRLSGRRARRGTWARGSYSSAVPPRSRATPRRRPRRLGAPGSVLLVPPQMSTVTTCYQISGLGLLHLVNLLHQGLRM